MIENKRRIFSLGIASLVAGGFVFAACGGSDGSALINGNPNPDGSGPDVSDAGDSSAIPLDGSGPPGNDGGVITDGGANFGDAGTDDDGGDFPDGGSCNRTALGDSIMSTCSALSSFETGGALVNGNYTLTKVTDQGSFSFCSGTFVAVPFRGGAVISSGATSGTSDIEIALDGDSTGRKSYSWNATPASGNKSPLAIDETCPTTTSFSLPYTVTNSSGVAKQAFEIVAPYGTGGGDAVYHFEKD